MKVVTTRGPKVINSSTANTRASAEVRLGADRSTVLDIVAYYTDLGKEPHEPAGESSSSNHSAHIDNNNESNHAKSELPSSSSPSVSFSSSSENLSDVPQSKYF